MLSFWQFNRYQNNVSLTYDEVNQDLISIDEINLTPSDTYIKLNGSFNLIDYYKLRSRVYNGESGYHIVAIYKDQDNIHLTVNHGWIPLEDINFKIGNFRYGFQGFLLNYDIKSPSGDIIKVIENVKFQMELVAQNNHLFVQFAQDGGETPSGIALKIKDLERFEDYQDDLALFNLYEHKMYEVEKILAASFNVNLPNELKIDFNEPEYPMTVQDQIALDTHRLNLGLINRAELMVEYNKDLSIQEASAKLQQNDLEQPQGNINVQNNS